MYLKPDSIPNISRQLFSHTKDMKAVPKGRIKCRLLNALKPISGVLHEKPFAVQTKPESGFHPLVLPLE